MYVEIKLDNLTASPMNHFRKLDGENWEEFLASIKAHGILNPITVRPIARDKYEILAGHNRVRAAKEAGLKPSQLTSRMLMMLKQVHHCRY